jgi:hypothetical protein
LPVPPAHKSDRELIDPVAAKKGLAEL